MMRFLTVCAQAMDLMSVKMVRPTCVSSANECTHFSCTILQILIMSQTYYTIVPYEASKKGLGLI